MFNWLKNPYRHAVSDAEDLSYPPSGGYTKLVVFGLIVPVIIWYFGIQAWITEEAFWFGQNGSGMNVFGRTAKALGLVYSCVGFFFHFRWFWGLLPIYSVYEIGTKLSLLGILGGLGYGAYFLMF
ncbi:MAG: hypothetical protein AAF585_00545 [Verrucomicrobiota bacterium]